MKGATVVLVTATNKAHLKVDVDELATKDQTTREEKN